ncbi:hypothetical protein BC943DRAFT_126517 [Umbelopsis sp. AD052]|nr:hypothetical protein BC943DRAFT_126517 [Umbelopsis sp. AD052]
MLHEDNRMNSTPSLASSSSSFIRPPSSRSVATSVYTTQFDEDEDPWGDFPTTDKATASQPSTLNDPYNGKKENEVSDVAFDLVTIPPFYHRLYKNLYNGNGVDLSSLHKVISASGISNTQGQQILNLIGKAQLLSEREFYGFLVCVALAQRHEGKKVGRNWKGIKKGPNGCLNRYNGRQYKRLQIWYVVWNMGLRYDL